MDPPFLPSPQANDLTDSLSKHEIQDLPQQESDHQTSGSDPAELLACIYHLQCILCSYVYYVIVFVYHPRQRFIIESLEKTVFGSLFFCNLTTKKKERSYVPW